jgi:hypothetical protein
MGAQHRLIVDVVGIRATATRVVWWEAQDIKVLSSRDNGVLFEVVAKHRRRKLALNELACNGEGMILVEVQAPSHVV